MTWTLFFEWLAKLGLLILGALLYECLWQIIRMLKAATKFLEVWSRELHIHVHRPEDCEKK